MVRLKPHPFKAQRLNPSLVVGQDRPATSSSLTKKVSSATARLGPQGATKLLSGPAKPKYHPGRDAKVVLMIVCAVIEMGQVIIGLKGTQADVPGEANI
jgi:hypothetical protein